MSNWNNLKIAFLTAVGLITVVMGAVRGAQLATAFDGQGYPVEGFLLGFMHGLVVTSVVMTVVLGFNAKPEGFAYDPGFTTGAGLVAAVTAGFLLVAGGAYGVASHMGNTVRLVLSIFALLSGGCTILAVKAKGGALAVVPVFCGCFLLLTLYVEHSGDAVLEHYGYQVLAAVAGTAAFYCTASSSFGVEKSRFRLAASGLAVILGVVALITAVFDRDIQLAAIFAAMAVLSAGQCIAICVPRKAPAQTEGPSEEQPEE